MVQPCRLVIGLRSIDLEHDLEGDTIDTINSYLKDNKEKYQEFHNHCHEIVGDNADLPETVDVTADAIAPAPEKPKRGRKPKAPVEAVAPAPIPVPDAAPPAPPAPVDATPNAGGIPAFLDRNAPPVAVAPPPPPMVAPPVPAAPAAPVSPPVGGPISKRVIRIVETIRDKVKDAPDGGAAYLLWLANPALNINKGNTVEKRLVNWVAATKVITPVTDDQSGPTFQELIDVLSFAGDDRLLSLDAMSKDIADALQIA